MPPRQAEIPLWVQGTCTGRRKEEWEPGGGKSLIASSSQGVSMRMAAPGGTTWLEAHWSTPCCPDKRDGRKDESCLWKQDRVPGKMLCQGCPSWDSLFLGFCHLLCVSPHGNGRFFSLKQDLLSQTKQCGTCTHSRHVSTHLQLQMRPSGDANISPSVCCNSISLLSIWFENTNLLFDTSSPSA